MKKGLKTDLEFRFGVNDDLPNLNFVIKDPPEKVKEKIIVVKKNKKKSKKINSELF